MKAPYVRCIHCGHVRTFWHRCPRCQSADGEELDYGYEVRCSFCGTERPHTTAVCVACGADEFEGQEYSWCDKATLQRIRDSKDGWMLENPVDSGSYATLHIPSGLTREQEEAFTETYWPGMKEARKRFSGSREPREGILKRLWRKYGPSWL